MGDKETSIYQPASLDHYSLKDRIEIKLADAAFYLLIRVIGKTLRFEVEGLENLESIETAGKLPIYVFWHNRIFAGTYFFRNRGIAVITSKSKDGEYIARFIQRFGYGAIRGSSTRGGVGALVEMIRAMRRGIPTAFTADGPKGPVYLVKPGPIMLAKKTGNPILPFSVEIAKFWTIRSWDRLQIPKPFSKAKLSIAKALYVTENIEDTEFEKYLNELQSSLDELVFRGKQWRRLLTKENQRN